MKLSQLWCQPVGADPQTVPPYRWESSSFFPTSPLTSWTVSLCVSRQYIQIYDEFEQVCQQTLTMHKHLKTWGGTGGSHVLFRLYTVFMTLFIKVFFSLSIPPVHNWLENEPVLHDSWTDFLIKCRKVICSENKNADLPKFLYGKDC